MSSRPASKVSIKPGQAQFVIMDMEYPRLGVIRVDSFDQVLVELRQTMK